MKVKKNKQKQLERQREFLEELQADLPSSYDPTDDLENAESCETLEDFRANIATAIAELRELVTQLEDIEGRLNEFDDDEGEDE